jgi:acetyl esterase/lipase
VDRCLPGGLRKLCSTSTAARTWSDLLGLPTGAGAPFPSDVEDVVAAYGDLLEQEHAPEFIAFAGDSAGGGLTKAETDPLFYRPTR